MKTLIALVALGMLAVPVHATGGVPVTFHVTLGSHLAPDLKTCALTVPVGTTTTAAVLDAAVASGCISAWTSDDYGTPGHPDRFVTSINGISAQTGTFWAFYVNEQFPCGGNCGIDGYAPQPGDAIKFAYVDWFTPFTGVLP